MNSKASIKSYLYMFVVLMLAAGGATAQDTISDEDGICLDESQVENPLSVCEKLNPLDTKACLMVMEHVKTIQGMNGESLRSAIERIGTDTDHVFPLIAASE